MLLCEISKDMTFKILKLSIMQFKTHSLLVILVDVLILMCYHNKPTVILRLSNIILV